MAYPDIASHDLSSLKLFSTMSRADSLEKHLGLPCSNLYGITEGLLLVSRRMLRIPYATQPRVVQAALMMRSVCLSRLWMSCHPRVKWANCLSWAVQPYGLLCESGG